MELPGKLSEPIVCKTRPKSEEHMLINNDKSTNGEHLCQLLQNIIKPFKIVVTL